MKKMATVLAVALMMSMAVPTFAAIDLSGKVETQLELGQNAEDKWEVTGKTGVEVKTGFKAEGGKQVKAVVQLDGWKLNSFDDDDEPNGDFNGAYPSKGASYPLNISKVWFETDGPFWNGGPSVSTRVGDVDIKWNDLVGHIGAKRGITVQGMEVGPIEARGFYAFEQLGSNQGLMGLQADARIAGIDLGGMVTHRPGIGTEMAANASAEVVDGIEVEGEAAMDAAQNTLYRVGATIDTIPGVTLTAGYRGYNDFAGAFAKYEEGEDDNAYDKHTGFNVGMETVQNGIELAADYDQPTDTANVKAETTIQGTDVWASAKLQNRELAETKFGATRAFQIAGMDITGEYEGKLAGGNAEHVLRADTTLNMIPELQGLGVNAEVKLNNSDLAHWAVGAEYNAPNGVNLGAEYHSVDGPSVTAGLKASF